MNRILFWLKISRLFSLPMTVLSWAVIFTYALSFNGNITNGILALFGIAFAHLSTNVFDDYIDYRTLDCKNVQQCKCEYIRNGEISQNEALGLLRFEKPNVQYCIRSERMLQECLTYIESEQV